MVTAAACFHCGDPLPAGRAVVADLASGQRPVCCPGCKAVAEFIEANGLAGYYEHRDEPPPGEALRPEVADFSHLDAPALTSRYVAQHDGTAETTVDVGGMYCSACSWLLDRALQRHPAICSVDINPATHRAVIRWRIDELPFSGLLAAIADVGFRPQPVGGGAVPTRHDAEYKAALKRLIVAAAAGMQVMMFAIALYAGERFGIEGAIERFLRTISLLVTLPIVFYSARPFFAGAWRGLRARAPGMDLPVALAIGIAFAASARAVWLDAGAVYFDSVAMFVLFLSGTRFLEMRTRHRADDRVQAFARLLPDTATRIHGDLDEIVAIDQLQRGDRVRIRPGDVLPTDGDIHAGHLTLDESLLSGESAPVLREAGASVYAGAVNRGGSAVLDVTATGAATRLAEIARLLDRARADRPPVAVLADRVASAFVVGVLVIAAGTGVGWWFYEPARAFEVVLATLVVTCPCALALATPAALAAAASRLARDGLFLVRSRLLEVVRAGATFVFDKTGTLTRGAPVVSRTRLLAAAGDGRIDETRCLAIAAAIETASEHVLARAFARHAAAGMPDVGAATPEAGQGVAATVDGVRYRIGNAGFVAGLAGPAPAMAAADDAIEGTRVYLGSEHGWLAEFRVEDDIREDAAIALAELRAAGFSTVIASGDRRAAVAAAAAALGVDDWHAALTPEDKLAFVAARQRAGETVVMVGDGINDAPVLAAADASVALDAGTALARASADAIALSRRLRSLVLLTHVAESTRRIIRQNVAWAIGYNLTAVPLAASGLLAPWMAALGMSLSSLLVVLNALRLQRSDAPGAVAEPAGAAAPVQRRAAA